MRVGNLSPQRDFTDVRDVAAAYLRLAEAGRPGEAYLICSGQPVTVRHLLDTLIDLAGVAVTVYGSNAKIAADTGWRPTISLRQSLADALADWEGRLKEEE